jgi:hypothetical protein
MQNPFYFSFNLLPSSGLFEFRSQASKSPPTPLELSSQLDLPPTQPLLWPSSTQKPPRRSAPPPPSPAAADRGTPPVMALILFVSESESAPVCVRLMHASAGVARTSRGCPTLFKTPPPPRPKEPRTLAARDQMPPHPLTLARPSSFIHIAVASSLSKRFLGAAQGGEEAHGAACRRSRAPCHLNALVGVARPCCSASTSCASPPPSLVRQPRNPR